MYQTTWWLISNNDTKVQGLYLASRFAAPSSCTSSIQLQMLWPKQDRGSKRVQICIHIFSYEFPSNCRGCNRNVCYPSLLVRRHVTVSQKSQSHLIPVSKQYAQKWADCNMWTLCAWKHNMVSNEPHKQKTQGLQTLTYWLCNILSLNIIGSVEWMKIKYYAWLSILLESKQP